ncbi:MAG: flippase-like domain-containing protein [Bacteroidetes bacterium]|nr:flippase-like domain-containing protein [Bacteroidota bacterium]
MANKKLKKAVSTVLKIAISAVAIGYLVYSLSPEEEKDILNALKSSNKGWLLVAFVLFNLSKIISSIRLNKYFNCLGLKLKEIYNLKLYYLGMFYNLFLPGGIGGDGYKVYLLHKKYDIKAKGLIAATLLDRLSGVVVLGFMALILALLSTVEEIIPFQNVVLIIGMVAAFPIFWFVHNKFFKTFNPEFVRALVMGFGVQLSQLICAAFILLALNVEGSYFDYMTLFLVSSVVAVLPFTIGGVGARELVFSEGVVLFTSIATFRPEALAFSVLFFVITAVSSLIGVVYTVKLKE